MDLDVSPSGHKEGGFTAVGNVNSDVLQHVHQ